MGVMLVLLSLLVLSGPGSGMASSREEPRKPPLFKESAVAPANKLRVAFSAISVNQAIPWISHDAGLFKKYRLEVELIHASSITAIQALLAGEIPLAQSATDASVIADLNGADTLIIATILDKPLYSFLVNPIRIKGPEDLKGKRLGITRFGSTPDALTRAVLQMWGLDPVKDVTLVQLNEMGLLVAGLENDVIDGAAISIPNNIRAKRLGYTELFDRTRMNKTFITGGAVITKRFINEHRDITKLYMKAYLEGIKKYLDDEEFSI